MAARTQADTHAGRGGAKHRQRLFTATMIIDDVKRR